MIVESCPHGAFGVVIGFDPKQVVVGVRGEVDICTAPELGGLLDAVLDQGHTSIVLDLAEVDFLDAAGLRVIVHVSGRLRSSGGELTLRSASVMIRRILDITGLIALVHVESFDPSDATLGPEQRPGDGSTMVGSTPADLSSDLTRVAAIPANVGVVDAALRLVVALTRETVGGADGVTVTLSRHGQMTTVASSDETIAQMDRDQYATGEGPCLAAATEGRWFHVESLAEETRWPEFIPRAIRGGISSILSTPLLAAARPVGALNIYSNAERAFGAQGQELAALFATQASGILTDAAVDVSAEQVAARLQDALRAREVIAQAQGVIMEREGVSAEDAFAHLRRSSRDADVPVRQHADDVVATSRRQVTREPGSASDA